MSDAVSAVPASIFARNLHEMAAHHHAETADGLEKLLTRLGRDGLSMEEWNALISAISHERLDSWRRKSAAQAIEARRAETGTGSVEDERAVPEGNAP